MKGDFSRDSFNRLNHFSRVLMQQGRVQVDADWNEQVSILLHYLQTLAADIIGPYAGPASVDCGFEINITSLRDDLTIGKGRYYVNGILCENEEEITFKGQSYGPGDLPTEGSHIVYLDVWERHITWIEDDSIREKALGGVDTATRSKTVWQVRIKEIEASYAFGGAEFLNNEIAISKACLRAEGKRDEEPFELCLVEPEARYRGPENQLYRVEVHNGDPLLAEEGTPTFKWSRENGSVAFPIKAVKSNSPDVILELESFGRDDRFGLAVNDWVEIEDDSSVLNNVARPLLQVQKIDRFEMTVTLGKKTGVNYPTFENPVLLRRWDQKKDVTPEGVLEITESSSDQLDEGWLEIEHGIKIQFKPNGIYRTGDYWLIPARTALGDVEWPEENAQEKLVPKFLPPHGVMHNLAPLATFSVEVDGTLKLEDCRCKFRPLSYACYYAYYGQLGIGIHLLCPEETV